MNHGDLYAVSVAICNNLAPGTRLQMSRHGVRYPFTQDVRSQFTALQASKEVVVAEDLPKFGGADDAGRRSRHARV